jgi:hypothetical protein
VLPERAHVFDAGVVQKIYPIPGLEVGRPLTETV